MKLYRVITWKLLCDTQWLSDVFSTSNGQLYEVQSSCRRPLVRRTSDAHWLGEGMTLLIGEDVNLLKGIFLVGKMRKFMTTKWYSFRWRGDSPHLLREQRNIKGGGAYGQKGDTGSIIVRDNPAGQCFVLGDLIPSCS